MRLLFSTTVVALLAAFSARAQTPAAGPAPTGLVVGSGNFFSPIVADLDKAVAFYRDGLGLEVTGAPSNADANPALRQMFGMPDAQIRWTIGRPGSQRTGVEIVEIKKVEGRPVERRVQDSGAFTLIALVRDIDGTLARLKQLGAPVMTRSGAPVSVRVGTGSARAVLVKDPDGHFVELVQPNPLPDTTAPATANVIAVRVRLTVDDVEKAMRLYRDVLGLHQRTLADRAKDPEVMSMLGLESGQYRLGVTEVPTSGLLVELIEFSGVDRRTVRAGIQDPGSTRMQLQVKDVDTTIAALKAAGGAVVSSGGGTVNLPGRGGATTKVAIVRDPNNLFLVLLQPQGS